MVFIPSMVAPVKSNTGHLDSVQKITSLPPKRRVNPLRHASERAWAALEGDLPCAGDVCCVGCVGRES